MLRGSFLLEEKLDIHTCGNPSLPAAEDKTSLGYAELFSEIHAGTTKKLSSWGFMSLTSFQEACSCGMFKFKTDGDRGWLFGS